MMSKTGTSGDDAAEEWSIPVNWEKYPAIKVERRRRRRRRKRRRRRRGRRKICNYELLGYRKLNSIFIALIGKRKMEISNLSMICKMKRNPPF